MVSSLFQRQRSGREHNELCTPIPFLYRIPLRELLTAHYTWNEIVKRENPEDKHKRRRGKKSMFITQQNAESKIMAKGDVSRRKRKDAIICLGSVISFSYCLVIGEGLFCPHRSCFKRLAE